MPLFEYKCGECGTIHEELSPREPVCPKCYSVKNQQKQVTAPGLLKGLPMGDRKTKTIGSKR